MRLGLILIGVLTLLSGTATRSNAGQFVEFESAQTNQVRLIGYLARPSGLGPFPAVVVLHGSGGFHSDMISWADRLRRWGYVALAVDSFGPRRIESARNVSQGEQVADAFQALQFLKKQPFVRADDVAVLGFSMGGISVLAALERGGVAEKIASDRFRAGIAFYPYCTGSSGIMTAPTLVLIGELDDWTPAEACREMVAGRDDFGVSRTPGDRSMVDLVVYPGARHGFDIADLRFTTGVQNQGHRLEYNDAATRDSIDRVRSFLQRTLSAPSIR
jgi:dienelactone hydrolase